MDFTPTEVQQEARDLAARIFGDLSTHERLSAAGSGTDAELWKRLGEAGLLEAVEEVGLLGLVLLLEEQGRTTAQVPFAATGVAGLLALGAFGTRKQQETMGPGLRNGSLVAVGAFSANGPGHVRVSGGAESSDGSYSCALTGVVPVVPWLRDATHVLVPDADRGLWLVRTQEEGVGAEPVETTAPWSAGRLTLDGARAERLGGPGPQAYGSVRRATVIAFAGLQAGVCAGTVARAVEYTSQREQFGRPLSTKQAVQLRAADAHMDTEAIRVTAYEAAWRYDQGLPHATHALTAAWWASEAGRRVVHAGQHLHGGMGADLEHPVHRHFLWGRQIDAYLGGGGQALEELGRLLVEEEEEVEG
ncbi:acyl-CoA/acyl-ACP dehydrogenase [Streptomyces sp. NBC_00237]|uniref:acyl-CoA dehydrogenase family protein n=1 Tax=Streptomyces sp. NBC_00237 TaxID=2975687 RepID=UPI002257CB8B|nr:acyl-CoA dehydrogenase family protein [Streptomyces sp. NBC_00237]MCX5199965.1 acyl-CoA/acyl-ACP dehydrogenase [Streptomyces sp. NBC_00237]